MTTISNGTSNLGFYQAYAAQQKTGAGQFFQTKTTGTENSAASSQIASSEDTKGNDAAQKFLDYMSQSPEERWQEQWLSSHGMTKEEFEALPPDEKQAVIDKMTDEFKQHLKEAQEDKRTKPGQIVSLLV